jgi:hypothetical protein
MYLVLKTIEKKTIVVICIYMISLGCFCVFFFLVYQLKVGVGSDQPKTTYLLNGSNGLCRVNPLIKLGHVRIEMSDPFS